MRKDELNWIQGNLLFLVFEIHFFNCKIQIDGLSLSKPNFIEVWVMREVIVYILHSNEYMAVWMMWRSGDIKCKCRFLLGIRLKSKKCVVELCTCFGSVVMMPKRSFLLPLFDKMRNKLFSTHRKSFTSRIPFLI